MPDHDPTPPTHATSIDLVRELAQTYHTWLDTHHGRANYEEIVYAIAWFAGSALARVHQAAEAERDDATAWETFQVVVLGILQRALDEAHTRKGDRHE